MIRKRRTTTGMRNAALVMQICVGVVGPGKAAQEEGVRSEKEWRKRAICLGERLGSVTLRFQNPFETLRLSNPWSS